MARLIVSATAYGILSGFAIIVSVSSNDGKPVANLKAAHFKVHRLAAGGSAIAVERAVNSFQDFSKAYGGEGSPLGFYGLGILSEDGGPVSPGNAYVFAVVVTHRPDRGQAIAEGVLPA